MMSLKELVTVLWIPAVYIMTIELSRERGERERGEREEEREKHQPLREILYKKVMCMSVN